MDHRNGDIRPGRQIQHVALEAVANGVLISDRQGRIIWVGEEKHVPPARILVVDDEPGVDRGARRPELLARFAFVTGDALGVNTEAFLAEAGRPVVTKPFTPKEIHELLEVVTHAR